MGSKGFLQSLSGLGAQHLKVLQSSPTLLIALLPVISLLCWRIWRFTILPLFNRDHPKEFPYWIPYLGHAVAFLMNPENLLSRGRDYFGKSRQPFALTIAGIVYYIPTSAEDVTKVYKNTTTLSFDELLFDMIKSFGSSHSMTQKLFKEPGPSNPKSKSVVHLGHDWQVQQTQGKGLKELAIRIKVFLEESFTVDHMIVSRPSYVLNIKDDSVVVSLKDWTSTAVISAIQTAYFGNYLAAIDPSLVHTLIRFDMLAWQIFYQYPPFLSREMNRERDTIIRALTTYFEASPDQRPGEAWFTRSMEKEYRMLGFTDKEIATIMMFTYWGINTNVSKVCFWALAFIVHDQELLKKIRDEIAPAFTSESADLHHITHSCHLLNAVWLETLRLASISSSIRYITEDTMIGGKALRKGHRVMISARRLHFDEAVFGEDINVFRPSRFMKNPELRRHPGFRPFGGGVTLCPGRHLAKHTVLTFIALAVHRFDVTLDFPQSFPRFEEKKPIVGIMFGEDDLTLRLSRRVDPDGSGDGR